MNEKLVDETISMGKSQKKDQSNFNIFYDVGILSFFDSEFQKVNDKILSDISGYTE